MQIFASFWPLWGQNNVARTHFVIFAVFCPHKGLGRMKICIKNMVHFSASLVAEQRNLTLFKKGFLFPEL